MWSFRCCNMECRPCRAWVMSDKSHSEHKESALTHSNRHWSGHRFSSLRTDFVEKVGPRGQPTFFRVVEAFSELARTAWSTAGGPCFERRISLSSTPQHHRKPASAALIKNEAAVST